MAKTSLPTVTSQIPQDLRMFLDRVRETLAGVDLSQLDARVRQLAQQTALISDQQGGAARSLVGNQWVSQIIAQIDQIILASQLYQDLGKRIDIITGPSSVLGSAASLVAEEAKARAEALSQEAQARIAEAQAALDAALAEIAVVRGEIDAAQGVIDQDIADVNAAIATADARITTVRGEIDQDIADTNAAIATADARITTVRGEIDQDIADANAAITAADARITTVRGEIDQDIADANARITTERGQIDAAIEAVDAAVLAADTRITTVRGEIDARIDDADAAIVAADARITTSRAEVDTNLQGARDELSARIDSVNATLSDIEATPDFDSAESYALGALARYNSKLYRTTQATTAPSPLPTDAAYWEKVGDYATFADAISAHSEAITALNTVSADSESATASTLSNLKSTIEDPATGLASRASVTALEETKADIYGASAEQFTSLSATFGYDDALAEVNRLGGEVLTRAEASARIDSIVRTEAGIYGASVEKFTELNAAFNATNGRITAIETVDVTADTAFVTKITELEGSVGAAEGRITAMETVDLTSSTALMTKLTELDGSVGAAEGRLTAMETVDVTSGTALVSKVTALEGSVGTAEGRLTAMETVDVTAETAFVTKITALEGSVGTAEGRIKAIEDVDVTSGSSLVSKVTSLDTAVNDPALGLSSRATVQALEQAKSDIYGASASAFTGMGAEFTALTNATSAIAALEDVSATSDSATARKLHTLESTVSDPATGLTSKASSTDITEAKNEIYAAGIEKFSSLNASIMGEGETLGLQGRIDNIETVNVSAENPSVLVTKVSSMEAALEDPNNPGVLMSVASVEYADEAGATFKSAEASQFSGLSAKFTDLATAQSDIVSLNEVSADSDSALARATHKLNTLLTDPETNELLATGVIDRLSQSELSIKGAELSDFTKINAEVMGDETTPGLKGRIDDIADIKIDAEDPSVLVTTVHGLNATVNHPTEGWSSKASLQELDEAKADVWGAEASRFTGLESTFSYDDTLADVNRLGAEVLTRAESAARVDSYIRTESNVFNAKAEKFAGLSAELTAINQATSEITTKHLTQATPETALAEYIGRVSTVLADEDGNLLSTALVEEMTTAISEAQKAGVTTFTGISAALYGEGGTAEAPSGGVMGAINTLQVVELGGGEALVQDVNSLTLDVYGGTDPADPGNPVHGMSGRITAMETLTIPEGQPDTLLVQSVNKLRSEVYAENGELLLATIDEAQKLVNTGQKAEVSAFTSLQAALYGDGNPERPDEPSVSGRIDQAQNLEIGVGKAFAEKVTALELSVDGDPTATPPVPGIKGQLSDLDSLALNDGTLLGIRFSSLDGEVEGTKGRLSSIETLDITADTALASLATQLRAGLANPDYDPLDPESPEFLSVASVDSVTEAISTAQGEDIKVFTKINAELYGDGETTFGVSGRIDDIQNLAIDPASALASTISTLKVAIDGDGETPGIAAQVGEMAEVKADSTIALVTQFRDLRATVEGDPSDPNSVGLVGDISDLKTLKITPGASVLAEAVANMSAEVLGKAYDANGTETTVPISVASKGELTTLETTLLNTSISDFTNVNAKLYGGGAVDEQGNPVTDAGGVPIVFEGDVSTLIEVVGNENSGLVNKVDTLSGFFATDETGVPISEGEIVKTGKIYTDIFGASVDDFTEISAKLYGFDGNGVATGDISELNSLSLDATGAAASALAAMKAALQDDAGDISSSAIIDKIDAVVANPEGASGSQFSQMVVEFGQAKEDISGKATISDVSEAMAGVDPDTQEPYTIATAVQQIVVETDLGGVTALEVAGKVTDLEAQYTVKIDNNGYVSGFGLASVPNALADENADPSAPEYVSEFYVRANRFAVGSPGAADCIPFKVLTTPTTLGNGHIAAPGVYIDAAYIINLSADTAQLGITAQQIIDTAGLGSLATANTITADKVTDSGDLITKNEAELNIPTGDLASKDTVRIGHEVKFADGSTIGTYDLVTRLAKIGSADQPIANVMATSAITNAYIGNAEVSTLKIQGNAVTVPLERTETGLNVVGTGSWRYAIGISYNLPPGTESHKVQIIISVRLGYTSQTSVTTGYILRHSFAATSQGAWDNAMADVGSDIINWGAADAINDFVSFSAEKHVLSSSAYNVFWLKWYGASSSVIVDKASITVLGVKR